MNENYATFTQYIPKDTEMILKLFPLTRFLIVVEKISQSFFIGITLCDIFIRALKVL